MVIRFELPDDIERELAQQLGDLNQAAKEALLVAAYERGKLNHVQLSVLLGLDRLETDTLLHQHHVTRGTVTFEDLEEQRQTLGRVLNPARN